MFVIKLEEDELVYAILSGEPEEEIVEKPLCECYDSYGNVIGCYDAGCITPDNPEWEELKKEDPDIKEHHTEAKAYIYWDGHNWRSLIFETEWDEYVDAELLRETDPELEKEILEAFVSAEKLLKFKNGYKKFTNNGFEFTRSLWQGDYAIAWVRLI